VVSTYAYLIQIGVNPRPIGEEKHMNAVTLLRVDRPHHIRAYGSHTPEFKDEGRRATLLCTPILEAWRVGVGSRGGPRSNAVNPILKRENTSHFVMAGEKRIGKGRKKDVYPVLCAA